MAKYKVFEGGIGVLEPDVKLTPEREKFLFEEAVNVYNDLRRDHPEFDLGKLRSRMRLDGIDKLSKAEYIEIFKDVVIEIQKQLLAKGIVGVQKLDENQLLLRLETQAFERFGPI